MKYNELKLNDDIRNVLGVEVIIYYEIMVLEFVFIKIKVSYLKNEIVYF